MTGHSEQHAIKAAKPLAEMGSGGEFERVTNLDGVELEAFMQEIVVVKVHKTQVKGELEIITPSVNGKNQPIVRGVSTPIKRKYVEALINGHSVTYEQHINQNSPDQYQMKKVPVPSYPFDVEQDTEKGKSWKRRLELALEQQV